MPDQPTLYKPKYPNGPKSVWDGKIQDIKKAPVFNLVNDLMPRVNDGGSCPSFMLDLDFGSGTGSIGSFGSYDIAPPCWLWAVLRAITILSAFLLARRLIFGG